MARKPNLLVLGIDSLRADHMSLYGYHRLTTPHMDKFAANGTVFEQNFSPHIPTTSGYGSMFTGMDAFGMDVVALRHQGGLGVRAGRGDHRGAGPGDQGLPAARHDDL